MATTATTATTAASTTLSPMDTAKLCASPLNSSASSIREDTTSTFSDSGHSESSLGGLNHVNDGVEGSTTQRRMSRVYSFNSRPVSTATQLDVGQLQTQQDHGQDEDHERRDSTLLDADGVVVVLRKESCWKTFLRRKVPIFGWLLSPGYNLTDLPDDLIAGI
ncbi:hypothetical protein BGZ65_012902, partial [Modicella reniformis]